ncbi:diaminopimelate decarboxylase [uncultured Brevibacillus sp.]|uniref:diaminopimelate decarboxylase n=1 Tax=uncultured Brevibacillus sp. TaxID=169970 RepID=UPI00338DD0B1
MSFPAYKGCCKDAVKGEDMYEQGWLEHWSEQFQSPFYVLDDKRLVDNYQRMERAFSSRYDRLIIAYSYKTNYLPHLCRKLHELGAYAEVVSRLEYDLAQSFGVQPKQIVFNGPLKREEDIILALDGEAIVNLDSFSEIPSVIRYAKRHGQKEVKIGLRVNFDLSVNGESPLQNGYEVSRFGFCVENGNFERAIRELSQSPNIRVVGLHGHFSTNRSLGVYEQITQELCFLAREYLKGSLEYIDVGGGMYGELPASFGNKIAPSYEDYAEMITAVMKKELLPYGLHPVLIVEPGISLVADAVHFACRVVDVKENRGVRFVLVDGSVHNVKPTMHKHPLPVELITAREDDHDPVGTYHVVGYTCMEKDYLVENGRGRLPQPGDFLVFGHVGAYTIVFQPPFIQARPPIIAFGPRGVVVAREKETLDQFCPEPSYQFTPFRE